MSRPVAHVLYCADPLARSVPVGPLQAEELDR